MKQYDRKLFACVVENTRIVFIAPVLKDCNGKVQLDRYIKEPTAQYTTYKKFMTANCPEMLKDILNLKLYFKERR